MTHDEKVEQARALSDAGLFKRKIIERNPLNVHDDEIKLDCGHTTTISRRWTDEIESECYDCRRQYEPTPAWKKSLWRRWYVGFAPLILIVIFYVLMLPRWIEDANKREAQKQQEWQELKDRVTKLEEQIKSQR